MSLKSDPDPFYNGSHLPILHYQSIGLTSPSKINPLGNLQPEHFLGCCLDLAQIPPRLRKVKPKGCGGTSWCFGEHGHGHTAGEDDRSSGLRIPCAMNLTGTGGFAKIIAFRFTVACHELQVQQQHSRLGLRGDVHSGQLRPAGGRVM